MAAALLPSLVSVKAASWDTQQRLTYTPHRTTPKKPQNPKSVSSTTTITPTVTLSTSTTSTDSSTSILLSRSNQSPWQGKLEDTYLGYETWLPSPPKVGDPRSIYNAASLAYIGDSIYELYARRHFLFPPLNIEEYNDRVMAVVRCEAQDVLLIWRQLAKDAMLQKLLNENYLSKKERDILRWGKNIVSAKTRTKKRVGAAVYNRASSLETLVGYLYLTNVKRLEEIMLKLGFSCAASPN